MLESVCVLVFVSGRRPACPARVVIGYRPPDASRSTGTRVETEHEHAHTLEHEYNHEHDLHQDPTGHVPR